MFLKPNTIFFFLLFSIHTFSQEQFKRGNFMFSFQSSYAGTKVDRQEELKNVAFFKNDYIRYLRDDNIQFIKYSTYKSYNLDYSFKTGYFVLKNLTIGIKASFYYEKRTQKDTVLYDLREIFKKYPDLNIIRWETQSLGSNGISFSNFSMSLWARYYIPIQKIKSAFWLEVQLDNSRINFKRNIADRMIFGLGYSYLLSPKISLDASFHYIQNFTNDEYFYYDKHTQFSVGITYYLNIKNKIVDK